MKINPVIEPSGVMRPISAALARPVMHSGGSIRGGLLSDADIAMIKTVTNTEFDWPPKEGEGFPQAASDLSMVRLRQSIANSVIGQLDAKSLLALGRSGDLDPEFVSKAVTYLETGKAGDPAQRVDLRSKHPFTSSLQSGSIASDGSHYL